MVPAGNSDQQCKGTNSHNSHCGDQHHGASPLTDCWTARVVLMCVKRPTVSQATSKPCSCRSTMFGIGDTNRWYRCRLSEVCY